jgi:hypothetical protein
MSRLPDELIEAYWGVIAVVLFALIAAVTLIAAAEGQNIEGQPIASQYGTWQVSGYAPDTYNFAPTSCRVQGGASFFAAFTIGTPIKIVDGNPSLSEVVTPSNVVANNNTCSIAISPSNHHNLPFYLTSATGGLQEAINSNLTNPGTNTIILDNRWYQLGGSPSIISSVKGSAQLGLVDVSTVPTTFYTWNGSEYVEITFSGAVSSVFGRTGAVAAESGDYTCLEVTGCQPNSGLGTTQTAAAFRLASAIEATDTTIPLTTSTAALAPQGVVVVDSEWIEYAGVSGDDLLNAVRGYHQTTAANHASAANVLTVLNDFGSRTQAPQNYVVSSNGTFPTTVVFGCASLDNTNNVTLQVNCQNNNETFISAINGTIQQGTGGGINRFDSELGVGPGGGFAPITNSGYLFDSTRQNQSTVPQGFGAGIAGPVISNQPLTIAAPSLVNFSGTGTTTWSYECTGTDVDGNTYPGTIASITDGPATITSGEIIVSCPFSAGAMSETVWRTAGGPNQGSLLTETQPATASDSGGAATPGTPPSSNSTIPKICIAGEQFCEMSGTTPTPTIACSSTTKGWTFHNISATASPFVYVCNASAWVVAY